MFSGWKLQHVFFRLVFSTYIHPLSSLQIPLIYWGIFFLNFGITSPVSWDFYQSTWFSHLLPAYFAYFNYKSQISGQAPYLSRFLWTQPPRCSLSLLRSWPLQWSTSCLSRPSEAIDCLLIFSALLAFYSQKNLRPLLLLGQSLSDVAARATFGWCGS